MRFDSPIISGSLELAAGIAAIFKNGYINFYDITGSESYVQITAPNLINSSYTLTLPTSSGASGEALLFDGTSSLYWGEGGGSSISASYALTASYAENAGSGGTAVSQLIVPFTNTASISIEHSLETEYPLIQVYDSNNIQFLPSEVITYSDSLVRLTFFSPSTGNIVLSKGGGTSVTGSLINERVIPFTNTGSITFTHDFNSLYPLVQVYDSNDIQFIPDSVESIDASTVKVSFVGNTSGNIIASKGASHFSVSSSYAATASYALNGGGGTSYWSSSIFSPGGGYWADDVHALSFTGSIGIGTAATERKLHIMGDLTRSAEIALTDADGIGDSKNWTMGVQSGSIFSIRGFSDFDDFPAPQSSTYFAIKRNASNWTADSGYIDVPYFGVGTGATSNTTYQLHVGGTSFFDDTLWVQGNVGIGTQSPTSSLHIQSDVPDLLLISGSAGEVFSIKGGEVDIVGDLDISGTISKGAGSFKIRHPDPTKSNYHLYHSFVESPTAGDNIYRFKVEVNGSKGEVILPEYYKYLNENDQVWISPYRHFGQAYGFVNEEQTKVLISGSRDGMYNVLLIGTRKDRVAREYWNGPEIKESN